MLQRKAPPQLLKRGYQTRLAHIHELQHLRLQRGLKNQNSLPFRTEMEITAKVFHSVQLRALFLVHGTFVGDDPFGILRVIEGLAGSKAAQLRKTYRIFFEKNKSKIYGDMGNFTHEYLDDIRTGLGKKFHGRLFSWSSSNHHHARVIATFELTISIAAYSQSNPNKAVLLMGHSHGGNLFALLTRFVNDPQCFTQALGICQNYGAVPNVEKLHQALHILQKTPIYCVTFGTPVRYPWKLGQNFRALHIINHREQDSPKVDIRHILRTTGGDYIQLLGNPGVDTPSRIERERNLNDQLGALLEGDTIKKSIREILLLQRRAHSQGDTILMDYHDSSRLPNFVATRLGHGIYTRTDYLLCHFKLIRDWISTMETHPKC